MEEGNDTVGVGFQGTNGHAFCAKEAEMGQKLDGNVYDEMEPDFTVDVDTHEKEREEKGGAVVVTDDEDEDCCMENLDNCCGENVRGIRDCACCLKQCTCEIFHGCRHLNCKTWLKSTFNKESVKNKFPVLKWLPKYRLPHLLGDVIAGLTVGLTVVPQSIAFAKIALLPAQYGIYTAMTCVFIYIVFGTAKDVNLGPAAVLSLLVSKFAKSPIEGDPTYAIALAMMCGIVQFVLGTFHLGFIVNYVSHPVLESFTTAAVITIAFGQVRNWLGLEGVPNEFLDQVYWTFKKLPETKIWDFVLGLICMIALFLLKKMKTTTCMRKKGTSIPERIIKYILWLFSTAKNAVVVIFSIVAAYLFHINGMTPFGLTGDIPAGLPPFKPPSFSVSDGNGTTYGASDIFETMGLGIILVPLISYVETMAIAKNFARKNNYKVDKDQELIASGIANLLGSFLSAYPITGTFSGSAVNFQSGVRTTGAGLYTGGLVMLVLLFLTPVFYYIPTATLAAVIMLAVLDLADFGLVIKLWNVKKIDLVPWFVTFVFGLCLGIENGIILGIIVALCILIFPSSRPKVHSEPIIAGSKLSITSSVASEYVVLVIDQGLMFPSVEYFVEHVMDCVLQGGSTAYKSIILDFVHITSVDFSLVEGLSQLSEDFEIMEVKLVLCRVRRPVQKVLRKSGIKHLVFTKDVNEAIQLMREHPTSTDDDIADLKQDSVFVVPTSIYVGDGIYRDEDNCSGDNNNGSSLKSEKGKDERKDSSFFSLKEGDAVDFDKDDDFTPIDGADNFSFRF